MISRSRFRSITVGFIALALLAGVTACTAEGGAAGPSQETVLDSDASATALQAYVDLNQEAAMQEMARYNDVYSDFAMEAEGSSTLIYRYTFRDQVDVAIAKAQLAAFAETLGTAAEIVFDEMESAGVVHPAARWTYHNADGTLIESFDFAR